MMLMKRFSLLLFLLFSLNSLYAQKPVEKGKDSLLIYEKLYLDNLQKKDTIKSIYYGEKWKSQRDKVSLEKDSTYCDLVQILANLYYDARIFNKAIPLMEELVPIKKAVYGEISQSYVYFLNRLALSYGYSKNYSDAIRLSEKCLEIQEKLTSKEYSDYEMIVYNLYQFNLAIKNYAECVRWGTEVIKIQKKTLGPEHPDYALTLNNLASYYSYLGNYQEAIRLGSEALEIRKKVLGTEHPSYATSLGNLASFYSGMGNNKEAIRLETEALEIRRKALGPDHPNVANSLNNLASYNSDLSNYQEAIRLSKEALEIQKRVLGAEHPDYATSLGNLAIYYSSIGNYQDAIRIGTETLEIRKRVLGVEHPNYATSLSSLGDFYSSSGNYQEAIRLATEALEIRKKVLGPKHPDYAGSLNNLAGSYSELGNYQEAIRLATEALEIQKEVLGSEHPVYALTLNNLAYLYSNLGDYQEAIRLGTKARDIRKKVLGPDHPDYALSVANLADFYSHLGNYQVAILLGIEALEIKEKVLGPDHPDFALSIVNLAGFYNDLGRYQEAIRLQTEALVIQKKALGSEHPHSILSLSNLSFFNYNQKKYSEAYSFQKSYVNLTRDYILNSFSELSSNLQESLWNEKYVHDFNLLFPSTVYQHQTKESISELYDKTALFAKGILLNSSVGMRKLILESGDTVLISKYDALSANKSIYEKQLEKPIKERFLNVDSLHTLIQQQEMELARESKAYGDFARNLRINWKDVQLKLDKNDIAIEFLDFPVLRTDSVMYVALTLKKGYDSPRLIPLFEKKQLDAISQRNYYTQTSLYDLVWKPLTEELKGARDIYFSPSGSLHRIGIEYVPVSDTENIFDQYRLHRLSSTRQLAFIQDETSGKESVLYGGLVYDAHPSQTDKLADNRSFTYMNRADVDSLSLRGSYEYLPGTKDEADNIASYLKKYGQSYVYRSGAQGTEESFKQLDGSRPKTLHIATHGFYMTQEDAEIQRLASGVRLGDEGSHYQEDKPMTRSGLLLSGCGPALKHEILPEGVEDGILTAQEISKLDLRGLDLVVLSACQTGLGDIISGEGVFGLQRGFKNAGARTIIMSLWKVSDSATQQLMSSFYSHYLQGKRKEESFRLAQSELREKGSSNQSKPDWAAFVMLDGVK